MDTPPRKTPSKLGKKVEKCVETPEHTALKNAAIASESDKTIKTILSASLREGEACDRGKLFARIVQAFEASQTNVQTLSSATVAYMKYLGKDYVPPEEQIVCTIKRVKTGDLTFKDIVGQQKLKNELLRSYIYPIKFASLFRNRSKGVMLYGPPGTGKTLIVKAATNALDNTAFFAPSTGELLGKYLGDVEKKIDSLYKCAARELEDPKTKNAVIFLDEFDTIAGLKSEDKTMARSVNALLQAMDGIGSSKGVSTIAATNYPWKIESAVKRRFSNEIFVDLADSTAMVEIMEMAIFANYYDIDHEIEDRPTYHNQKKSTYKYIEDYGSNFCRSRTKKVKGYFGTTGEEVGKPVTHDFLVNLAENRMGMDARAKSIVEAIHNNRRHLSTEDQEIASNMPRFGYSPSDIARIMEIAIGRSAERALSGKFKLTTINKKQYYVSTADKDAKYVLGTAQYLHDEAIPKDAVSTRVLNFSFCEEDMLYALDQYKPTVGVQDYMDLVRYSVWKLSPDEK